MKKLGRFLCDWTFLGVMAVVLAGASTASAAPQQGKAVVRAIRGSAEYSTGAAWAPLKVGMTLYSGTAIKTAQGSQVDLFLGLNGPVVRVTSSTILGLDKLVFDDTGADTVIETQLDLKTGRILGNVRKTSSASRYEIKTPVGVAGIRGTEYDIASDGTVRVKSGSAVVVHIDANGTVSTHVVNAGQKFVPGAVPPVQPLTPTEVSDPMWEMPVGAPGGPQTGPVTTPGGDTVYVDTSVSPDQ